MYCKPGEWAQIGEARSIGSIIGEMRELAVLRARAARRQGRKPALHRQRA